MYGGFRRDLNGGEIKIIIRVDVVDLSNQVIVCICISVLIAGLESAGLQGGCPVSNTLAALGNLLGVARIGRKDLVVKEELNG